MMTMSIITAMLKGRTKMPATLCDIELMTNCGCARAEHNIYGIPCESCTTGALNLTLTVTPTVPITITCYFYIISSCWWFSSYHTENTTNKQTTTQTILC